MVLKAIWDATRCDLLHNNTAAYTSGGYYYPSTRNGEEVFEGVKKKKEKKKKEKREVFPPPLLPGILKPRPQGDLVFYKLTWGSARISLATHRHSSTTSPSPAGGGRGINKPSSPPNEHSFLHKQHILCLFSSDYSTVVSCL